MRSKLAHYQRQAYRGSHNFRHMGVLAGLLTVRPSLMRQSVWLGGLLLLL